MHLMKLVVCLNTELSLLCTVIATRQTVFINLFMLCSSPKRFKTFSKSFKIADCF